MVSAQNCTLRCHSFKMSMNIYISAEFQDSFPICFGGDGLMDGQNTRLPMLEKLVMKLIGLMESAI